MAITLRRQLDDEEKAIIAQRFGRKCFVTGHSIADDESIQYDHIRAFALGGKSEPPLPAKLSAQSDRSTRGPNHE